MENIKIYKLHKQKLFGVLNNFCSGVLRPKSLRTGRLHKWILPSGVDQWGAPADQRMRGRSEEIYPPAPSLQGHLGSLCFLSLYFPPSALSADSPSGFSLHPLPLGPAVAKSLLFLASGHRPIPPPLYFSTTCLNSLLFSLSS